DLKLWHCHLRYLNPESIFKLKKYKLISGLTLQNKGELSPCTGCAKGKHPQAPFPATAKYVKKILEQFHMDLQGPFDKSINGYFYALTMVNDYS
ncbi:hypothetical protein BDR04DRAFT_1020151, partial [Suillus decipiens]